MTTTTTLPIELHVIEEGTFFAAGNNFDAAIMMENENAIIESIIYIELHELKYFLEENNGFEFPETEDRSNFMAYLEEDSEKGKTGIEFVNSSHAIMQFLNNFINSDFNESSKTVKQ